MAKKKVNRQSNGIQEQTHNHQKVNSTQQKALALSRQSSMEDHDSAEEKVQSLKSLNAMLLKEAVEKRQQIESLVGAKDALEAELARSGSEKSGLWDELGRASDENVGLELEMAVFLAFVESRLREISDSVDGLVSEKSEREIEIRVLKSEANELMGRLENERDRLSSVCVERDSIKNGFHLQEEETNRLREKVIGLEKKEEILDEEIERLKTENKGLLEEMKKREDSIEMAKKEMGSLEKTLEEKMIEIDDLNREIDGLVRDKKDMEMGKVDDKAKIDELERELMKFTEIVSGIRNEERILQEQVLMLEKKCVEAMEKETAMVMQIGELVKEKAEKIFELEKLTKEKNLVDKQMETVVMESMEKEKLFDGLSRKKNELEEHMVNREAEFAELGREVDELKHVVVTLQKDYKCQEEKNEELVSEVNQLKNTLAKVERERDNAGKALDDERRCTLDLKSKVSEFEERTKETFKELEKFKSECESLVMEKKDLENQSKSLRNERNVLEKDIGEAKRAINVLKSELGSAEINAERALALLKATASLLCQSENTEADKFGIKQSQAKEIEPFMEELEAIKKAFKNKENVVEGMNKEFETMKHSVEQAHKRKSFWTIVSSAMTIFAAASVAYAARIR